MPRLFSAIEIPRSVATRLSMLREPITGAKWVEPEDFHLTLRFLGDVDGTAARDFAAALEDIALPGFDMRLEGLGAFGGAKPRAIYAAVPRSDGLLALQRAHERAAHAAGLPAESRKFQPHVTLARLRGVKDATIAHYLGRFGGFAAPRFPVARFVIFSAKESVGGGPYVIEEAFPLLEPA